MTHRPMFLLLLLSLPSVVRAEGEGTIRVVVLDIKAVDTGSGDVATLPATIEKEVARHPGFEVISREKLAASITASGTKDAADCVESAACVTKVTSDLGAAAVVGGYLEKKRKGYEISLSLVDARRPSTLKTASENMKRLSSLSMNVALVLEKIFKWDEPPVPPPEFELPPDDTTAAPPPAATPPPAAAAPPVIVRTRRIAVLAVKTDDVSASDVKGVSEMIVKGIGTHKGFEAASEEEVVKAIEKAGKSREACTDDKNCAVHVAETVHADLVIVATVSKSKKKYSLQLNMTEPGAPKGTRVSESMKRLSSLPMNVPICLDSLLH